MPLPKKQIGFVSRSLIAFAVLVRLAFAAGAIEFQTDELPRAVLGSPYEAVILTTLDGRCPAGNVALFVAGGSLPRGLHITESGLAGVPEQMGLYRFWIGARNTCTSGFHVYDLLVTGRPILRAFPEKLEFRVSADDPPATQIALIAGTWPNLTYRLSTAQGAWLAFQPEEGSTPRAGSALTGDRVTVSIDSKKLPPGVHHGAIVVSAWRADAVTIDITVTVTTPASIAAELQSTGALAIIHNLTP